MRRSTAAKQPRWTPQEIAILIDVYPRDGIDAAIDALPDRSKKAIEQRAHKLALRSPIRNDAPKPVLDGDRLERAIALYEGGTSFTAIARTMGCSACAATNAILMALCPRRGYRPATRDATGRLTPESKDRLRYMLKKGLKAVEIQLRSGISAACVAEERRRYNRDLASRDKALLPPPGAGEQYCGARIPAPRRRAVEAAFMQGFGAHLVSRQTGVSVTTVKKIRLRLVKRLARKGETLPGCDASGKRIAAPIASLHYIPESSVAAFRARLMAGEPVRHAARAEGIGSCGAYRLRDALRDELAAEGRILPEPIRLGRGRAQQARGAEADWLPRGRMQEFRALVHAHGQDEAKRLMLERIEGERADATAARAAELARPKTFEEQLARITRGEVGVIAKVPLRRPDYAGTLGGVATGAL